MSQALSFQYTIVSATSSEMAPPSSQASEPMRRFVPGWNFVVEDDGRSVSSVRDFLDHMVPPLGVAEACLQSTSQLVDAADMDLFNGIIGYVIARKRVTGEHEQVKKT